MWSRMMCRSGGWLLLITSLLISHHPAGVDAQRKFEHVYVADPVGIPLSRPSNVPAKVGSPAVLIQPDRYEFYTFDESGELIKRLMTLEEIQEIIATGDTDDGHILTVAQSDINKPAVTFNFEPPSNTKVHSIVSNVQNVLKSEMEAQKNNPPKEGMFDTPDVSSSWSQILPAIFGNTGGSIAPDSLLSPHVGPETDFITPEKEQTPIPINNNRPNLHNQVFKENINPIESKPTIDALVSSYTQAEDLLDEEDIESKTTLDESPNESTQSTTESSTTAKSTTEATTSKSTTTTTTTQPKTSTTTTTTTEPTTTTTTTEPTATTTTTQATTTTTTTEPTTSTTTTTTQPTTTTTTTEPTTSTTTTTTQPTTTTTQSTTSTTTTTAKSTTKDNVKYNTRLSTKGSTIMLPLTKTTSIPYRYTTSTPTKKASLVYENNVSVLKTDVKETTPNPTKTTPAMIRLNTTNISYSSSIKPSTASNKLSTTVKDVLSTQSSSVKPQQSTISNKINYVTKKPPQTTKITSDYQSYSYYNPIEDRTTETIKNIIKTNKPTIAETKPSEIVTSSQTKNSEQYIKYTTAFTTPKPTTKIIIKDQIAEKTETTQKYASFSKPLNENISTHPTNKPYIFVRNNTYYVSTARTPTTEPIKIVQTTQTSESKLNEKVGVNQSNLQYTTQPELIKISSSNTPTTTTTLQKKTSPPVQNNQSNYDKKPSITTEKYRLTTTPYKIQLSSTEQQTKPEIDINQIINQIALDLGDSQKYEPPPEDTKPLHVIFTHNVLKDEVTTYHPNIKDNYETTTARVNNRPIINQSSTVSDKQQITSQNHKQPSNKIKYSTTTPRINQEIQYTTSKITEVKYPEKVIEAQTSSDLSDSITNLLSQISNPQPTIVPINANKRPTTEYNYPQHQNINENIKNFVARPSTLHPNKESISLTTRKSPDAVVNNTQFISSTRYVELTTQQNGLKPNIDKRTTVKIVENNFKSTTPKVVLESSKKPISNTVSSTNGHYIIKTSPIENPIQSTNKFEIYKTSNEPTTTSIKKILTPEISTQKTANNKFTASVVEKEKVSSNEKDKPLIIDLLANNDTLKENEFEDKFENSEEITEDSLYDGSDAGDSHDDELMEMLNKYSEMFNSSPDMEAKSDEIDELNLPLVENKKGTSYKKTDLPEDDFYPFMNISQNILPNKHINITENLSGKSNASVTSNNTNNKFDEIKITNEKLDSEIVHINQTIKIDVAENNKSDIDSKDNENKVKESPSTTPTHSIEINNSNKKPENVQNDSLITIIQGNIKNTDVLEAAPLPVTTNITQTEAPVISDPAVPPVTPIKILNDEKKESSNISTENKIKNETTETQIKEEKIENNKPNQVDLVVDKVQPTIIQKLNATKGDKNKFNGPIISNPEITKIGTVTKESNVNEKESNVNEKETMNLWTLVSTASPHNKNSAEIPNNNEENQPQSHLIGQLHLSNEGEGLEKTTTGLSEDVYQFAKLCNELGFRYWKAIISNGIDPKRSLFVSPFAITSSLAMIFMATRGSTSEEMNEILKLDDMVTFNPHIVFKNVTESIEVSKRSGVATSAIIRELYSDRSKGRLLSFYKDRVQKFYSGHVEEVNFGLIGDIVRRRTNLLVKRQTWSKIPEYIKQNNLVMRPPLAVFSANIFQTDCSSASTEGRDGEMYFVVSPTIRQRRLVPVPSVVYRSGFLAGYVIGLDATAVAIGTSDQIVSTIFLMPGQQGSIARGDDIIDLEKRFMESVEEDDTWKNILKSLIPRSGLELQIPRLSHRSILNGSLALQSLGLKDLFDANKANLAGLNGQDNDLHLSDMVLDNTFATCGEGYIGEQHHIETYPGESNKLQRRLWRTPTRPLYSGELGESWDDYKDYQRAFHDPLHDMSLLSIPLHLRPRQARLPDHNSEPPRLKFDRPFIYFVRHNPTGLILHMGRYNPRLLP